MCEHPVLELESFCVVMAECEVVKELLDHGCISLWVFFDKLLRRALISDADDDLEELIEVDLRIVIDIVLLDQLVHPLHGIDEAETD